MTRVTTLIAALSLLIAADCTLTAIAVGYIGATELNPLCAMCGGLPAFLMIKVVVSVMGVIGLLCLRREMPKTAKISAGVLCVLYATGVTVGIGSIVVGSVAGVVL